MSYWCHFSDVIMRAIASQITSLTIGYSTVYSRRRSKKHQSSASLASVREFPPPTHTHTHTHTHKGPVMRKLFSFGDATMVCIKISQYLYLMETWTTSVVRQGCHFQTFKVNSYVLLCLIEHWSIFLPTDGNNLMPTSCFIIILYHDRVSYIVWI